MPATENARAEHVAWYEGFMIRIATLWRRSVMVSALASINVVNRPWARLVLGWVTACGG